MQDCPGSSPKTIVATIMTRNASVKIIDISRTTGRPLGLGGSTLRSKLSSDLGSKLIGEPPRHEIASTLPSAHLRNPPIEYERAIKVGPLLVLNRKDSHKQKGPLVRAPSGIYTHRRSELPVVFYRRNLAFSTGSLQDSLRATHHSWCHLPSYVAWR